MKHLILIALLVAAPALAHPDREPRREDRQRSHQTYSGAFHEDGTRRRFYERDGRRLDENGRLCETCRLRYYDYSTDSADDGELEEDRD